MSKIIAVGDTHGRSDWKYITSSQTWDKVIFIGDYFDTHEAISPELQMINFREICQFKEKEGDKVVLLIGNHDYHYMPGVEEHYSGYNGGAAPSIMHLLSAYKDLLKMAHAEGDILFSHAGVGETWFNNNIPEIEEEWSAGYIADAVNDVWKYKPLSFKFTGIYDNTGDEVGQTPVWIRPAALLEDTRNMRKAGVIQIVGHTRVWKINIEGSKKNTGGKLFLIDTLETSGEYLIIEDNIFKTGKI